MATGRSTGRFSFTAEIGSCYLVAATKGFGCNLVVYSGADTLYSQPTISAHLNTTSGGQNVQARAIIIQATETTVTLNANADSSNNVGWCVTLLP